jgi:hypothetical protein
MAKNGHDRIAGQILAHPCKQSILKFATWVKQNAEPISHQQFSAFNLLPACLLRPTHPRSFVQVACSLVESCGAPVRGHVASFKSMNERSFVAL